MNLNPFRRASETPDAGEELRELTQAQQNQLIDIAMGFTSSIARSFHVTQETALTSTAVLACLIVRAETFSLLPAHVYRRQDRSRERIDDPLADLIGKFANPLMTSREFWRWKQLTEDIRGNAYAWVERRGGQPFAFWPMTARDMKLKYDSGSREAMYTYGGDSVVPKGVYSGRDVLHFRGPLIKDGYSGTSLVDQAATAIGLTVSSEQFYDRLLANGNHFPGYLQTDASLKPEDLKALEDQLKGTSGVVKAGELRVFDRGLKYIQNEMSIKDADLTLQQMWYLQEVCRVFRVPPPLVQDWSRATYTNSEQADLWFTKHTITPIAANSEAVVDRLFVRANQPDRYVKFEMDGLLRGDFKTRMEGYSAACGGPFMQRAEARELEDMNPVAGFDKPLVPLNYAQMDGDGNIEATSDEAPAASSDPLEPLRQEKLDVIRSRAAQDRERGRDETATRAFAEKVLAPLAESYRLAGLPLDTDALIKEALS